MKESRAFELNQVTAEQVLEAVTTFLRGEKGMEVQSVATPNAGTSFRRRRPIRCARFPA